jgi:hypothetical protein
MFRIFPMDPDPGVQLITDPPDTETGTLKCFFLCQKTCTRTARFDYIIYSCP